MHFPLQAKLLPFFRFVTLFATQILCDMRTHNLEDNVKLNRTYVNRQFYSLLCP